MEIAAGEFKAKCLQLMERVARTREPILITKRGRAVAKLVPADDPPPRTPLFGYMAGSADIRGELNEPPPLEWSAVSGAEDELYAELAPPTAAANAVRDPARRPRRK
jgi:prevent-host-death family protein